MPLVWATGLKLYTRAGGCPGCWKRPPWCPQKMGCISVRATFFWKLAKCQTWGTFRGLIRCSGRDEGLWAVKASLRSTSDQAPRPLPPGLSGDFPPVSLPFPLRSQGHGCRAVLRPPLSSVGVTRREAWGTRPVCLPVSGWPVWPDD